MNNRILLIIFIVLAALYGLTRLTGNMQSASFNTNIVLIDTGRVDRIILRPKEEAGVEFALEKGSSGWTAIRGDLMVEVLPERVRSLLGSGANLDALRIVTRNPDRWNEYEVDETGTRVQFFSGKELLADITIGGFKFDQATRSASSYVRLTNEPEVYVVDGFLGMQFNQGMDNFRNNVILDVPLVDMQQIEIRRDQDADMMMRDTDGKWYYAGMEPVDSSAFSQYVSGLSRVTGSRYLDGPAPSMSDLNSALLIFAGNAAEPLRVELYNFKQPDAPFIVTSTMNPGTYFLADSSLYNKLVGKLDAILEAR